jgi:ribosomal-protein-alanine N-acetyltransferase
VSTSRTYFMTTDRLGFSHWSEEDLALAMTLWGDPRVSAFIGGPFAQEKVSGRLTRQIEMSLAHKVQYWPVFLLQDGDLA